MKVDDDPLVKTKSSVKDPLHREAETGKNICGRVFERSL